MRPSDDEVKGRLERVRSHPLIAGIVKKLEHALPDNLHYHAPEHTENVLAEVVRLAVADNLSDRQVLLLAIAAGFHDSGFVFRRERNEVLGAALASDAMREAGGFSDDEVALVNQMILDTELVDKGNGRRQFPNTPLSKYLLDADLANFGRNDFFDRLELGLRERGGERIEFLRNTLRLLVDHDWHTEIARSMLQPQKEENLAQLKQMLARELAAA